MAEPEQVLGQVTGLTFAVPDDFCNVVPLLQSLVIPVPGEPQRGSTQPGDSDVGTHGDSLSA